MKTFRKITKERVDQIRARRDILLADVRTPEYFRNGYLSGAVNLYPLMRFTSHLHTLSKNKKQPIVIFSNEITDEDAVASANYAEQLGFENVYVADYVSLWD